MEADLEALMDRFDRMGEGFNSLTGWGRAWIVQRKDF
jgi:hypothetical protein